MGMIQTGFISSEDTEKFYPQMNADKRSWREEQKRNRFFTADKRG
jgi:hypothetical protein